MEVKESEIKKGAPGVAGSESVFGGQPATVTGTAAITGGMGAGQLIESDIDGELFHFNTEDAPLMNLMLCAKRVKVNSPEVDHYMIDEPGSELTLQAETGGRGSTATLTLNEGEENIPRANTTLLVKGVDGYDEKGERTPGKPLMLFVTSGANEERGPVVRAINGVRKSGAESVAEVPKMSAGTKLVVLANSLYETQKEVDPDLIIPSPTRIYLQKRGMNQVVSDYFESQRKRIPFTKSIIAEQAIANFKIRGNRTLWASRGSKFQVVVDKMGLQTIYTTEGIRWQIKREMQAPEVWNFEQVIALAKMFFTGEDVPRSAILLAGKNLLESIQKTDYSKHPEIQISTKVNSLGWTVTNFHTVFGDIEIKREPTLDRLGWSNSGALIGENRLVHYVYSSEHTFSDRVEGEEATRRGVLIWDALALKGNCHIWIEGDGEPMNDGAQRWMVWEQAAAPATPVEGMRYYLTVSCPEIDANAKQGQLWEYTAEGWKRCTGDYYV